MSIRDSALGVSLTVRGISGVTGSKSSKARAAAASAVNGQVEAFEVLSRFLPKASLQPIQSAATACRTFHYANTLAWGENFRIILSADYMNVYRPGMDKLMQAHKQLVEQYATGQYPVDVRQGPVRLGDDWQEVSHRIPAADQLHRYFSVAVRRFPLPSADDWRIDVPEEEMEALRNELRADEQDYRSAAHEQLRTDLKQVVGHLWGKLQETRVKDGEEVPAIFRNSTADNVVAAAKSLRDLRDAGLFDVNDHDLVALMNKLESSCVNADLLRTNDWVRERVVEEAAEVLNRLDDWGLTL